MKHAMFCRAKTLAVAALFAGVTAGSATAAPKPKPPPPPPPPPPVLSISQVPLFLGGMVQPNIVLTLDDSNSMGWSFMPDSIGDPVDGLGGTKQGLSVTRNWIAYDPKATYPVPYGVPTASPTYATAWLDGYEKLSGSVDLSSAGAYQPSWRGQGDYPDPEPDKNDGGAYYYKFTCPGLNLDAELPDENCYTRVNISAESDAQKLNFANWFSYYRTRLMAAKAAAATVVQELGDGGRLGLGTLNTAGTILEPLQVLDAGQRTQFLEALFGIVAGGETPLRRAADDVGRYFETAQPWQNDPKDNNANSAKLACRRSYHILMSDGYWNAGEAQTPAARLNSDGLVAGPEIPADPNNPKAGPYQYLPTTPYADANADTLADVAMYYWNRDLMDGLDNEVPTSRLDPAYWQHLTTIALGFGLEDTAVVAPDEAFAAIFSGDEVPWPAPAADAPQNVDDFLHAAVNSRGEFVNATRGEELLAVVSRIVTSIPGRAASSASAVLNSSALRSDTRLYQVLFNSSDWRGQLLAYEVGEDGKIDGLPLWDAGTKIKAEGRKIATTQYTSNGGAGNAVAFAWGSLNAEQQAALGSESVVAYLRGDNTLEISNPNAAVGTYRDRSSLLGDIVNSAPAYLGPPMTMYSNFWQNTDVNDNSDAPENAAPYSVFREAHKDRDDVIFVGANDGMLHAFDAEDGSELFAFVPGSVVRNLKALTAANYVASHRYFVDGSPTVGDAFVDGAWRTVLVASLGAGGQGLYALDVTDPTAANDAAVAGKVLWELTDANDSNLGYAIGQPNIVRAPIDGGTWVAMFGNGYSSTYADGAASNKGNAMLFAVRLEDRSEVATWDTGVGKSADPLKTDRANGLGPVAPVELNGDFTVDYAYAGDLFGNLWRFDFTANKVTKLFTAEDAAKNPQAITTRPSVVRHPLFGGVVVLFGTGKYFETGDHSAANQPTQTFYAIWDKDPADTKPVIPKVVRGDANTSELLQQKIIEEVDPIEGVAYRVTTDNPIEWKTDSGGKHYGWFIDLFNTEGGNTANFGERQVSDSLVRQSNVIFTTLIPSADVCDFGGSGWLMELDVANGGRPSFAIFDVNNDGVFNVDDYVHVADAGDGKAGDAPPTGRKSTVGIVPTPAILSRRGGNKEDKFLTGSSGATDQVSENAPEFARQSWQQHFAP